MCSARSCPVPSCAISTVLTAILTDALWCGTPKSPSHGSLPLPSLSSPPASPAPSCSLLAASCSVPALTLFSSSFSMSSRPSQTSNMPWPACLWVVPIFLIVFTTLTPIISLVSIGNTIRFLALVVLTVHFLTYQFLSQLCIGKCMGITFPWWVVDMGIMGYG
jgi:hypothetical protein